jgi:hypothetical protein
MQDHRRVRATKHNWWSQCRLLREFRMSKKTRNRSRAQRLSLRYRILVGTHERVVGQAQWHRHLKIGNLTRQTDNPHLAVRLRQDERLALVNKGLIAYENDNSQLCFEAPVIKPAPVLEPRLEVRTQYQIIVANLLKQEPILPRSERIRRIARLEPLLQCEVNVQDGTFILF